MKHVKRGAPDPDQWRASLDAGGRIMIPKHICTRYGLRAGDTCTFEVRANGDISVRIYRETKKGRWLDVLTRKIVGSLPGKHAVLSEPRSSAGLDLSDIEPCARGGCARVAGEILRDDFVVPLRLSAKKIAKSVCRERESAAAFSERLADFMTDSQSGLDLEDCLRLDRFFGLTDGYFWRVIGADEIRAAVVEHAEPLSQIRPIRRLNPSAQTTQICILAPASLRQDHARALLPTLIGRLSLDMHDRGWISFLPFTLWESVIGNPIESFRDEDVVLFRHLSEIAGGWAHFDDKHGPRFISQAAWDIEFLRWKARQALPDQKVTDRGDATRVRPRRVAEKKLRSDPEQPTSAARRPRP